MLPAFASAELKMAYGTAFDAWVSASHLRMGPSEVDDRAFALAYWPDTRGKTAKALRQLISEQDDAVESAAEFGHVSIAARGFYALEYLLFDPSLEQASVPEYTCKLVQAMTEGMAENAAAISDDWAQSYGGKLTAPGENGPYRTETEVVQALFKTLSGGMQFTSDMRLGRPLGTIDRPRPKRAEAWRSGRSQRHVELAIEAEVDLAAHLSQGTTQRAEFEDGFQRALDQLARIDDPVLESVATSQGRFQIDIVKLELDFLRDEPSLVLQGELGITRGFNALDGD
jgi:predicted lipoprotein